MKIEFDFNDLESQWKGRKLDLFPWLDGLFALIRSRESLKRETKKRLSYSSKATMAQFLSSYNKDNAQAAMETIQGQDAESVLPILLFSLEKVNKEGFTHRIMQCLIHFDPAISFGYFLGYLNVRSSQKHKFFQVVNELFPLNETFKHSMDIERFLTRFFQALRQDLKERMPPSGKLEKEEDLESIGLDLKITMMIFNKTWQGENAGIVENEMQRIGQEVIGSFGSFPFDFENGNILYNQLSKIIPLIASMRLESDQSFLQQLPLTLKKADLSQEEVKEISQMADAALTIIKHKEKPIYKIMEKLEISLFMA
ncbi:MAG: hypothetical protein ACMUIS_07995 [bacterium]